MISDDVPKGPALNANMTGRSAKRCFDCMVNRPGYLSRHSLNATLGSIH